VRYIDPSEHLRPEAEFATKPIATFRDYSIDENDPIKERVRKTYLEMHTNQTVQFVQDRIAHWTKFDKFKVSSSLMNILVLTFPLNEHTYIGVIRKLTTNAITLMI